MCTHDVTTTLDREIDGHMLRLLRCSRCGCLSIENSGPPGSGPVWLDPSMTTPEGVVRGMLELASMAVENQARWREFITAEADDPRWSSYNLGGY